MRLRAALVEAFTQEPCQGNGAAVVLLEAPLSSDQMQLVARSLNQSETAFLLRHGDSWLLRWFTPSCEVPLCGHATLAALLALGQWGELQPASEAVFLTCSGPLPVVLDAGGAPRGRLQLPCGQLDPIPVPDALLQLLEQEGIGAPLRYWAGHHGYRVALLPPEAPLPRLQLSPGALPQAEQRGLVLMQALEEAGRPRVLGRAADYQLRFFAPALGIAEDPVTGSAHALIAPYWLNTLQKPSVVGWQCSDRPGGMVCEAASSGMIRLSGAGHLLWNGSLNLPGWTPLDGVDPGRACDPGWSALLPSG